MTHQGTVVVTQPPHFPTMHTRELVTFLAAQGLDEKQVAVVLRCTVNDVRQYYTTELEHGLTLVNSRVMSAVLHNALYKDDVSCMKLWLINKAGWRAGDGNRALAVNVNQNGELLDGENMTVVQRREIITRILTQTTQSKRREERVIDAEVVKKPNGNGANEHEHNSGNGTGGSNGTKHR